MTQFRFRKTGYFMGKHFEKGAEIELSEKQGKYAVLSGQLEYMYPPPPKAAKPKSMTPFAPVGVVPPAQKAIKRDAQGEFSAGRKVGGSFGGNVRK